MVHLARTRTARTLQRSLRADDRPSPLDHLDLLAVAHLALLDSVLTSPDHLHKVGADLAGPHHRVAGGGRHRT